MRFGEITGWLWDMAVDVEMDGTAQPGRKKRLWAHGVSGVVQGAPKRGKVTVRVPLPLFVAGLDVLFNSDVVLPNGLRRQATVAELEKGHLCFDNPQLVSR